MKSALLFLLASLLIQTIQANTDVRTWTSGKKTFSAELVSYDPETDIAVFKDGSGNDFQRMGAELILTDRAWLNEWAFLSVKLEDAVKELGGELEHHITEGQYPTDLFIYHPPGVKVLTSRPLLIMFHPGGKAQRYLLNFVKTAAELKAVVVTCGTFRNTGRNKENLEKEKELTARFKEMFPQLEKHIAHDPRKIVMGGASGGAWRAFHYTAYVERPWKGIFSNGGWLGGPRYWDLKYPAMRVAVVNGHQDHANRVVEDYTKVLKERGCEIVAFSFKGGHQTAPVEHTTESIRWILEDPEE